MNNAMSAYLYYVAMSCTRGGQSHPGCRSAQFLLSAHWAWPRATALQVEFGKIICGGYTRGEPTRVP